MSIEKIKSWLQDDVKDFRSGLDLFIEHSKNRSLFLYLSRKQDLSKLEYELCKIAGMFNPLPVQEEEKQAELDPEVTIELTDKKPTAPEDNETIPEAFTMVVIGKKVVRETLPENLQVVYDSIVDAYRTQRSFHEKMKLASTDEDRESMRTELVKLDDVITDGWNQIDTYIDNIGKEKPTETPVSKPEVKQDPLSIGKEVNACRKFISINLSKLASLEGTAKDELKAKITERFNTLINLKVEIKAETRDQLAKAGII